MKTCTACKVEKQLTLFSKDRAAKDGLSFRCKACQKSIAGPRNLAWQRANRERVRASSRQYYQDNQSKEIARCAAKRVKRDLARPEWLSEEQKVEIQNFYWLARDLKAVAGEEYHVDHIVPLSGKNVCGLHVPWNLQVLPADINMSKGNR
tara:strand:+ start:446 stop:895 length:450 start_codon:yes stop_codon:yes gene_type:complete